MMSAIILAGGRSSRMGTDKAFLKFQGKYFIELTVEQMLKVSDDVIITVGDRKRNDFDFLSKNKRVRIFKDSYKLSNPLGGLLTGFDQAKNGYAAAVACDLPRIKSEVLGFLYAKAQNHSAAVPIWEADRMEPLCAVYKVDEARAAATKVINQGKGGPRNMVTELKDIYFVKMSELREYDADLASFLNINSAEDYSKLADQKSYSDDRHGRNIKRALSRSFETPRFLHCAG